MTTESQRHRKLLLDLAADYDDKSALLAYVNLMGIVSLGYRLTIDPQPGGSLADRFTGTLSSASGARCVQADSTSIALLARELVHRWMGGTARLSVSSKADEADVSMQRTAAVALMLSARGDGAPSHGQHAPTFQRPPSLRELLEHEVPGLHGLTQDDEDRRLELTGTLQRLETRCGACGAQLGMVSGIPDRHFCIRCDADELEQLTEERAR